MSSSEKAEELNSKEIDYFIDVKNSEDHDVMFDLNIDDADKIVADLVYKK